MKNNDIAKIDKLIHEKGRMGIMALLASSNELSFSEMRNILEMTDGNISVQLQKLQKAGYISITKSFLDNKPLTTCSLTEVGRNKFKEYISTLENIIRQAKA